MILKKMLKNVLTPAVILIAGVNARAQNTFTIHGQLAKDKQGIVMLTYNRSHNVRAKDSAIVKDGAFELKGKIADPSYATLELNPHRGPLNAELMKTLVRDGQSFFLEGTTMTVTSDAGLKESTVSGGQSQADFEGVVKQYQPVQAQLNELNKQAYQYKKDMNDSAFKSVQKKIAPLMGQKEQIDSVFIATHPDSYPAFDLWRKKQKTIVDLDIEPMFKRFSARMQNTEEGKILAGRIALAKKLGPGKPAPDFTLMDTLGHPVTLSSLKGKNVMVCFYVSNFLYFQTFTFNLGRINRRLHDKNFVILTVYFSNVNKGTDSMEYWKSVITQNAMNWINVADMGGLSNTREAVSTVAKAYGLDMGVPQAFLIGTNGKILARNLALNDTELGSKIEKIIAK